MAAIDGVLSALRSVESVSLGVHPERCVMVRNRNGACLRCAQVCASGAISLDDDGLVIDQDLCIGCGTCATICPTCALEALHPTDEDLYGQAAAILAEGQDTLVVSCARAMKREHNRVAGEHEAKARLPFAGKAEVPFELDRILQVVCLGRLDESFYVEMAVRGAREVVVCCESCETCRYSRGGCLALDVIDSATALIESRGRHLEINFVEQLPKWAYEPGRGPLEVPGRGASRREFLASAREAARDAVVKAAAPEQEQAFEEEVLPKVNEDGSLPRSVPQRRLRLFNSLRALGAAQEDQVRTRLWGRVSIDVEGCSSCRMCATFCPTGALSRFDDGEIIGVTHRPALCVQCRLCETICMKQVLDVSDEVSISAFEEGLVERIEMKPLSWKANRPDSIFNKVNGMFGGGKNNTYF